MHPFHWVPAGHQRHVSTDSCPRGGFPPGTAVSTLCGQELSAEDGTLPWLWPTCPSCNELARQIAGTTR